MYMASQKLTLKTGLHILLYKCDIYKNLLQVKQWFLVYNRGCSKSSTSHLLPIAVAMYTLHT